MNKKMKRNMIKILTGTAVVTTVCIGNPVHKDVLGDVNQPNKSVTSINSSSIENEIKFGIKVFKEIDTSYKQIFRKRTYEDATNPGWERYDEIDKNKYPREKLTIKSGFNKLAGFLYGSENTNGLIVISLGTEESEDGKLSIIKYFVDHNWKVLVYDYTGCYASEGDSMIGYQQMPKDLDAVLNYVEHSNRFNNVPVVLFGHSLGGYTSASSLQYGHKVKGAIIGSGFDSPRQVWVDSTIMYQKLFGKSPEEVEKYAKYADFYITFKSKGNADFSAVDGINSTNVPVLVLSGSNDEMYEKKMSEIYIKRDKITNPNCEFKLMEKEKHNTHNDFWYTDAAVDYRAKVDNKEITENINRELYNEIDAELLDYVNNFCLKAVSK